jgi:hypothetical protein
MPRAAGSRRGGDISTPRGRGRARAGRGRRDAPIGNLPRAVALPARERADASPSMTWESGGGSGGRSVSVRSAGRSSWSYPLSSEGDIYKMPRRRRVPGHHWVSAADARRSSPRSRRLNARRVAPRPSRERVRPGDRHPVGGGRHLSEWRQDCQLYLQPTVRTKAESRRRCPRFAAARRGRPDASSPRSREHTTRAHSTNHAGRATRWATSSCAGAEWRDGKGRG